MSMELLQAAFYLWGEKRVKARGADSHSSRARRLRRMGGRATGWRVYRPVPRVGRPTYQPCFIRVSMTAKDVSTDAT
jgi:hypothetical protein